jgi:ATP-dependent DNA helicase RecG
MEDIKPSDSPPPSTEQGEVEGEVKQADLRKLIKSEESETVELKASFNKEILETSGAFANTKGGAILIGISDKGQVKGIQIGKETLKDWANQISQSTEPRIIPEFEIVTIDGKNVAVIWIKEFPIKPVPVKGRCFRRVGSGNRVMQAHEIAEMHFQSTGMSWDRLPAANALMDEIDLEKVRQYIESAKNAGRRRISGGESPLQVLEKLELIKDGKATWAAILLFDKHPQRFLSQAMIHCGRFKGDTIVIDDRMIEGAVIEQIEEAMDFIRKNINVRFVMTGKPAREEVWDYPLEALREAVINAVCHRDYTVSSNTEVRIYDDELMVWNPGGLPLGLKVEDLYKPHPSILRNKGIGGIFYDTGLIEQWGSGMDKMRVACEKAGIPEPKLEERNGFRVIFRKDVYTEEYLQKLGLNERQFKAVTYVKEKGKITNKEYQQLTNVSKPMATIDLKGLVEKRILLKLGVTGRGTEYILLSKQRINNGLKGLTKD